MKLTDIVIGAGIILGAIYFLPKIFGGSKSQTDVIIPSTAADIIGAGGTITTQDTPELPWYFGLSPVLSIAPGIGYLMGAGTTKTTIAPKYSISQKLKQPRGYQKLPIRQAQPIIFQKSAPTKKGFKVAERIFADLPKTITVEPDVLQPMTIARLQSRVKYGTTSGR